MAERVVQRGSHTLNGIHLQVHPLEPKCPPPFYNQGDNLEKTRLLFRSLPIPTTLSDFTRYVEAKSGSKVTGWIVGSKSSNVILEFNSIPGSLTINRFNLIITCAKSLSINSYKLILN